MALSKEIEVIAPFLDTKEVELFDITFIFFIVLGKYTAFI